VYSYFPFYDNKASFYIVYLGAGAGALAGAGAGAGAGVMPSTMRRLLLLQDEHPVPETPPPLFDTTSFDHEASNNMRSTGNSKIIHANMPNPREHNQFNKNVHTTIKADLKIKVNALMPEKMPITNTTTESTK
jgi:hypothetical protein